MSYEKIRKNSKGGKLIPKFQTPAGPIFPDQQKRLQEMNSLMMQHGLSMTQSQQLYDYYKGDMSTINNMFSKGIDSRTMMEAINLDSTKINIPADQIESSEADAKNIKGQKEEQSSINWDPLKAEQTEKQKYDTATTALGIAGNIANTTMNAVDEITMGDKNFSAQSQAIDSGVHGLSSMAMKSGNPYLMAAGVALEGLNFVTKAGGRTVPGFDVDIQSSGYGNLGHMESSSGRIWDKWTGKTGRQLAKRNEQARMALSAADISQDQAYEQEARTNSVTNVLQANQIALAGGIDTSLLGN